MALSFNNVTYKSNLKKFNYDFEDGKITTIVSGESLSYFTYLISNLEKDYNGKITNTYKGRNIGVVFNNPEEAFIFNTVREELEFGLKYFKYKLNKKNIRISEALKLVGLNEEYLKRRIDSLNISEKKKVSLASILIFNPGVIIIEEPSIFLNYRDNEKLIKLIKLLKDKYNKTIILISKDTNLSYKVSDEIILLNKGSIVYAGNKSILEDEKVLNNINVDVPEIVKFINISNKFDANLTYTSNILDLIKEVYRNAK